MREYTYIIIWQQEKKVIVNKENIKVSKIILVTGGARSGKSSFAERLCKDQNNKTAYIATSTAFDEGMKDRIKKHRAQRPSEWMTYESYKNIDEVIDNISGKHQTVILDCITLMVNNLMFEKELDYDTISHEEIDRLEKSIKDEVERFIEAVKTTDLYVVVVTNEIGLAPVANNRLTRIYTDIIGRINQFIAMNSEEVYFVVSGIPMKIKG